MASTIYTKISTLRVWCRQFRGDFTIKTKVTFNPQFSYQGAGILIWQDSDNYFRLELNGSLLGIQYAHRINGVYFDLNPDPSNNGSNTAYLQFTRTGNTFYASFSSDGQSWQDVYSVDFNASDLLQVGVSLLNQWQDHPLFADFDYFEVNTCAPQNPSISGRITDGHLTLYLMCFLVFWSAMTIHIPRTTTADSDGKYTFTDIPLVDEYRIEVVLRDGSGRSKVFGGILIASS